MIVRRWERSERKKEGWGSYHAEDGGFAGCVGTCEEGDFGVGTAEADVVGDEVAIARGWSVERWGDGMRKGRGEVRIHHTRMPQLFKFHGRPLVLYKHGPASLISQSATRRRKTE